jgi:hypothetical protein
MKYFYWQAVLKFFSHPTQDVQLSVSTFISSQKDLAFFCYHRPSHGSSFRCITVNRFHNTLIERGTLVQENQSTVTQVVGWSCCGSSGSSVLEFGFELYSPVGLYMYTVDDMYSQF